MPSELSIGSISGVLCRGRIKLNSMNWDMNAKEIKVELCSDIDQRIILKLPGKVSVAVADIKKDPLAYGVNSVGFGIDPEDAAKIRLGLKACVSRSLKINLA